MTLLVRLSAIVAAAVTWSLWTAGPAAACTVSYQSGPAGEVCGGTAPAVAAGVVATAVLASAAAFVAIKVKSGQAVADLAHLARELSGTDEENLAAFQEEIVRRLNAGDPAIRELYLKDEKQRTVRRKDAHATVAGHPLPMVDRSTEGLLRVKPPGAPDAIRAVFHKDGSGAPWEQRHDRSGLDDETLAAADWLTQARLENLKNLAEAKESVKAGPGEDSRFGPDGPARVDRSTFNEFASNWGEKLGEYAGSHAARTVLRARFPGHTLERVLAGELGGAGTLDDIYRVRGAGGTVAMIVLETKGPEATQGARYGLDGRRYEQGHPEYLKTVLDVMKAAGRFGTVPKELADAVESGTLEYYYVRALVTDDGGGLAATEMTRTQLDELWRRADDAVSAAREQRPGLTDEEAARIHRDVRTRAVHATAVYAGFRIKRFDIGPGSS
ncbi:hypothetical protein [Actinophytocola algeriensis]|uniref:Uncharacterized protein n=1 Tax=Actinophytocola algeriensis TaxID=1768010 RepID=A0A7W7QDS0_9PSEU|nr:hypothetical protein [Actinophytocola algeriensis]MBB4911658.1 hypothetical protein [Actinophytocola algeriensis]MBE1473354.1 hypothetical protein [Actinophytocola algeriensis]